MNETGKAKLSKEEIIEQVRYGWLHAVYKDPELTRFYHSTLIQAGRKIVLAAFIWIRL